MILCSVIGKVEIYFGVRTEEEASVASLFASMDEIPVDGEVAKRAGRYRSRYSESHGVLLPDALVAASAKKAGAALVTLNKKHYPMPEITVKVPYGKRSSLKSD